MFRNSQGKIFYGMHFYPGVAEYQEPGKDAYRVFINEDTIRKMNPSFAGRPIYVDHVDEVHPNIDEVKKDADGWVTESFYNSADGKTWVKFILVSERAQKAVQNGMRLSNAYIPKAFKNGGQWNGVSYTKEITDGEFEHLAIVQNPRYEESVIMTPEQFKDYNSTKLVELKRLSNSKDKQENSKMKFNIFKRTKVENSIDIEGMSITLPTSKKEMTIAELVENMDKIENSNGYASDDHKVKLEDGEMTVKDLVKTYNELNAKNKKKKNDEEVDEDVKELEEDLEELEEDVEESCDDDEDEKEEVAANKKKKKNKDEDDAEKELEAAKKKEMDEDKKSKVKAKANALKNAHLRSLEDTTAPLELSEDQVARGKARYGSN